MDDAVLIEEYLAIKARQGSEMALDLLNLFWKGCITLNFDADGFPSATPTEKGRMIAAED